MNLSVIGEFGVINLIRKSAPTGRGVVKGIGDDAAALEFNSKEYLLLTTDMLVEGVHFRKGTPGRRIGHKALACNISDIAAMGGVPTYAVISVGLRPNAECRFLKDVYAGISALARKFKVAIVGGDTVKSEKLIINIALLGRVDKKRLVTRCGAKAGDIIFTTGRLGRSLQTGKHLSFTPRLAESRYLVFKFKPTAMIDISDGLAADLGHILEESKVGAVLEETKIPRTSGATFDQALSDGEDFELLFTLSPKDAERCRKMKSKYRFYEIGQITEKREELQLRNSSGTVRRIFPKGFTHF